MNHTRHLPAVCSLLLLAGPAAALAQAPLLPPTARRASLGEVAQAAPIAPPPATGAFTPPTITQTVSPRSSRSLIGALPSTASTSTSDPNVIATPRPVPTGPGRAEG